MNKVINHVKQSSDKIADKIKTTLKKGSIKMDLERLKTTQINVLSGAGSSKIKPSLYAGRTSFETQFEVAG